MNFDRPAVKLQARGLIKESKPSAIAVGAIFLALSVLIGLLSSKLLGGGFTVNDMQQYLNYVIEENYDAAMGVLTDYTPSIAAYLIDGALQLMLAVVSVGFTMFLLNTIRKTAPSFGNLLDGFAMIWRIFVLYFLQWLFILLWSLLLVVPGIIAAYRYRQAVYLLIDNPEMKPLECIRQSKEMMKGHKWELFCFDLSFIGWWLLSCIPIVGYAVQVWTTPYINMSLALYYEGLKGASVQSQYIPPFEG